MKTKEVCGAACGIRSSAPSHINEIAPFCAVQNDPKPQNSVHLVHPGTVIPLTRGRFALVDDADAERVRRHNWHLHIAGGKEYARGCIDWKRVKLHRFILGVTDPSIAVDHINGDGLDCRRSNLRAATKTENIRNRGRDRDSRSPFKGIYAEGANWRARILVDGKRISLGRFASAETAARAYDKAAREHYGEFARTNFK